MGRDLFSPSALLIILMYRLHVSERSSLHNLCLRSCNRKQFSKEIDSSSSLLTCLIHGSIDIKLVLPLKSLPPE
ncbi:hypothetical protein EYC84_011364 [Monilinia fructicola]|uniref:Uncharacterized protein n=1 Tax=Monilinia fructicola TaxID=38448 RepID=A0A5M9J9V1_MONFR|nr:hypothetical protein EYC84_011364 [Monilinia fructicola]